MDAMASTPGKARNVLSMMRMLMALAIEEGIRADDPTAGFGKPRLRKGGWSDWPEEAIAQFEARHPVGSDARLALGLGLYTAQRRADVIRMGRQHCKDGKLHVTQQKTGTSLKIPLCSQLEALLGRVPQDRLTFLVTKDGATYTANGFGHRFKLWCREAGLKGYSFHGLRKAACRRLAEAGCTAPEIMAISGHKSLPEVQRYIEAADQVRMGEQAIARTELYPRGTPRLPTEKKT